jgi:hypothetical protein
MRLTTTATRFFLAVAALATVVKTQAEAQAQAMANNSSTMSTATNAATTTISPSNATVPIRIRLFPRPRAVAPSSASAPAGATTPAAAITSEDNHEHSTCKNHDLLDCNSQSECLDRSTCCWSGGSCRSYKDNNCHPEIRSSQDTHFHSHRFPPPAGGAVLVHGSEHWEEDDGCICATTNYGGGHLWYLDFPNPNQGCELVWKEGRLEPEHQKNCWGTLTCNPWATANSFCHTYGLCKSREIHERGRTYRFTAPVDSFCYYDGLGSKGSFSQGRFKMCAALGDGISRKKQHARGEDEGTFSAQKLGNKALINENDFEHGDWHEQEHHKSLVLDRDNFIPETHDFDGKNYGFREADKGVQEKGGDWEENEYNNLEHYPEESYVKEDQFEGEELEYYSDEKRPKRQLRKHGHGKKTEEDEAYTYHWPRQGGSGWF